MPVTKEQLNLKSDFLSLTDEENITWNVIVTAGTGRASAYVTLTDNRTLLEPVGAEDGDKLYLLIFQDATGGRTLAFPSKFEFKGTSEIRTDASSYDILEAVYDETTDKYYCSFPLPRGYREKMLLPNGSNVNLDIDALTTREILNYDGKTIYQNGLAGGGGDSLIELPLISKVYEDYQIHFIMEKTVSGADFGVQVSGSDVMYLTGIGNGEFPILDTSGTDIIKMYDQHLGIARFTLAVRNSLGDAGTFLTWGIVNWQYTQTAYTIKSSVTADPSITRVDFGHKIKLSVTGNFTLDIPTGYNIGEEVEIIVVQDATGRTIAAGSGWKTAGGSWVGSSANAIYSIRATYQGSSEWYARIDSSIQTPV